MAHRDKNDSKISFIEMLYVVIIGAGFTVLPANPLVFGFLVFLFSIAVIAHDWYMYHDSLDEIEGGHPFFNFLFQILSTLLMYEMLIHSFDKQLYIWLIYFGAKDVLDLAWNLTLEFSFKEFYMWTTMMEAIALFVLVYLNWRGYINNWETLLISVITFVLFSIFEMRFDKKTFSK